MASTRLIVSCALTVTALLCAAAAPLRAEDSSPVVARANGVDIHQSDLAFAEEEIGGNMPQMGPDQKRDYLITYLADVIVMSQAAEQKKVGDNPDVQRRLAFDRNRVLMEALLQQAGKAAVTDAAMHKVYDDAVKQMPSEQEVHARHILVPTEDEAKAIEAELKKGADFATLAKEKSKDPGAADGGDLGYFTKDQMVPEFAEAAFKLDKGQISDPGADPVRLAHHQGRGQAHQADADLRSGQGPARELRRAPRPGGTGRQSAQVRQDRAPRQAGSPRRIPRRSIRRHRRRSDAVDASCPALYRAS